MASTIAKAFLTCASQGSRLYSSRIHISRSRILSLSTTPTSTTDTKDSASTAKAGEHADNNKPAAELTEIEKLHDDITALNEKLQETQDKYLRSLAEVENVRQRLKKQIDEAKIFGIQNFCKDLLDIADVLNQANNSIPPEAVEAGDQNFRTLFEGLTLTEAQLQKVFNRHGLAKILPSEGDTFDPHFHEALFEVPTDEKACGTIAILQKVGYKLHERTIRPAQVGVFKATA